jgi:hypothetical protein
MSAQPQPVGMRVETFEHKDFGAIKTDVEAWVNNPGKNLR